MFNQSLFLIFNKMNQLTIIIIAVFSFGNLQAQWHPTNSNTTENIKDIFMIDSLNGYCVGGGDQYGYPLGNGIVLNTTDSGENWTEIFSMDSLSINNILVVSTGINKKIIAFATINQVSYKLSTTITSLPQNWILEPISYIPKKPILYNNIIYYIDVVDNSLNKLENNTSTIITNNVSIFNVNQNGLIFIDYLADTIFYSDDMGNTIFPFPSQQNYFGYSQIDRASIINHNDSIFIFTTYPENITYSFDNGTSWSNVEVDYFIPKLINSNKIIAIKYGNITKSDYMFSNIDTLQFLTFNPNKFYFFTDSIGFILGPNGQILKTINGGETVGLNEVQSNNKIKIFPNPTSNVLHIEYANNTKVKNIKLFDTKGILIYKYAKELHTLDVSTIPPGEHVLLIQTKTEKITKKVFITR